MDNASNQCIEIFKRNKSTIIVSNNSVEIQRGGKAVNSDSLINGYVYLVIDCSGSMAGEKIEQAKRGAIDFSKSAQNKGYSSGLITFADCAKYHIEPQRDYKALISIINNISIDGGTNMTAGIRLAIDKLRGTQGFRVMVIVTDGMPNNARETLSIAQEAKNQGIDIIAIGTDDADQKFLKELASRKDLGIKVTKEHFETGISSTALMLPGK